jgi:hypothetical protein
MAGWVAIRNGRAALLGDRIMISVADKAAQHHGANRGWQCATKEIGAEEQGRSTCSQAGWPLLPIRSREARWKRSRRSAWAAGPDANDKAVLCICRPALCTGI